MFLLCCQRLFDLPAAEEKTLEEQQVSALLKQILNEIEAAWICESGFVRFRIQRGAMKWEVDCRCRKGCVEIYGRYPFQVSDRDAAAKCCGEANLRLNRGAMVLPADGRPVFRDSAEMDDPYGAADRLRRALEFNFRAVARFWGRMERSAGNGRIR